MLSYYFIKSLSIINNSKISSILSDKLYNNKCGILSNLYGESKKLFSENIKVKDNDDTIFLKKNHYVWLKTKTVKMKKLKQLKLLFDEFCNKSLVPKSLRLEIHSMRATKNDDELIKLALDILPENALYCSKAYFEKKTSVQNLHLYRIFSPNNFSTHDQLVYGSTDQWHIDKSPTNTLKIFILLHDIELKNGPMEFKTQYNCDNKTQQNILNCEGNFGDILIINTNFLEHRATYPFKNITRDLLCFNIETS